MTKSVPAIGNVVGNVTNYIKRITLSVLFGNKYFRKFSKFVTCIDLKRVFLSILHKKKQITGVGPAFPAWEASVLPMNHICLYLNIIYFFLKIGNRFF